MTSSAIKRSFARRIDAGRKRKMVETSGIATWMDLFDEEQHFQRIVVKRALHSPLLLNSICALTTKQLSLLDGKWATQAQSTASTYYGEALHHLIATLGDPRSNPVPIAETLAATILLSSYELLVCPGMDHRRHVSGALTLIRTHGCNAASGGMAGAAFWVYVRQDVAMALVHECPTMLAPEEWCVSWTMPEERDDCLGNQMVWLLAKVVGYTYDKSNAAAESGAQKESLKNDLRSWYESLPLHFKGMDIGLATAEAGGRMFFAIPSTGELYFFIAMGLDIPGLTSSAAAMCTYHLAHILLLAEGRNAAPVIDLESQAQLNAHAQRILTVCSSSTSDGALVQAVQALYLGQYLFPQGSCPKH
ncbi:uncharacterized protein DSM5745_00351 [Aspergillus mulundensis]|uniref:Uncharacterized protein n=1 Tax=Aspergillus mulundensis TaxID=1810919 RepID=A0A3D8T3C8_9EURO|nr:hypothetical protein DSM5745_00351 [Aspergillus mulundensis]RDW93029.1 hypothetical protein DSM5745_00351 [Aspergillus mulundensis]